jgi:hypothetical protein
MALLQIPTESSNSSCILPNGAQLRIMTRLRGFSGFWTIQLGDLTDGVPITDECPLIYNPNLFKQYIDVTDIYGIFSVEEDNNTSLPLEERLNETIRLRWNFPV